MAVGFLLATILGAIGGYGAVWLFPPPNQGQSGAVLQTKYISARSLEVLYDFETTQSLIEDMEIMLTTSGNSYLELRFSSPVGLFLDPSFSSAVEFNFTMWFDGVLSSTTEVRAFRDSASGQNEEYTDHISLEHVTDILPAGTYTINVTWYSVHDQSGTSQVYLTLPLFNTTRTLMVQEIHS
ncbi:hypothetical protein GF325_16655 [Candidatus Bathyarchaeota archaeon]|nr:hypothetical protein [Candidatus Bathyarchaeota archaeon]